MKKAKAMLKRRRARALTARDLLRARPGEPTALEAMQGKAGREAQLEIENAFLRVELKAERYVGRVREAIDGAALGALAKEARKNRADRQRGREAQRAKRSAKVGERDRAIARFARQYPDLSVAQLHRKLKLNSGVRATVLGVGATAENVPSPKTIERALRKYRDS